MMVLNGFVCWGLAHGRQEVVLATMGLPFSYVILAVFSALDLLYCKIQ